MKCHHRHIFEAAPTVCLKVSENMLIFLCPIKCAFLSSQDKVRICLLIFYFLGLSNSNYLKHSTKWPWRIISICATAATISRCDMLKYVVLMAGNPCSDRLTKHNKMLPNLGEQVLLVWVRSPLLEHKAFVMSSLVKSLVYFHNWWHEIMSSDV